MPTDGTDVRLASSRLHDDVDRLRAQVALSWSREARALHRLGLADGMAILEVGCGPGFVTERLLESFPHCSVTAIELDPRMSTIVRERLAPLIPARLRVIDASIALTPLPDDSFDFALARFVFQHLVTPELAVDEMFRLLKPRGRAAIIDIDAAVGGVLYPPLPAIRSAFERLHELQRKQGGDRTIGRRLWRLLRDAGFNDLDLEALVLHSDDLGWDAFEPQYEPARLARWIAPDGITRAEWDRYCVEYETLRRSPDKLVMELILLASGAKPEQARPWRAP